MSHHNSATSNCYTTRQVTEVSQHAVARKVSEVDSELIGDDWGPPDRKDWESMHTRNDQDQPSGDTWGFTPALSYEDRIGTVLFEAGTTHGGPQSCPARDGRDRRKRCTAAMASCRFRRCRGCPGCRAKTSTGSFNTVRGNPEPKFRSQHGDIEICGCEDITYAA